MSSILESLSGDVNLLTRDLTSGVLHVTADVSGLRLLMVNVYFIDAPGGEGRQKWVLVDAGLPMTAARIRAHAEERYGEGARPEAIVLTHGHFDHVGALQTLAEEWDVPIYAHALEVPYLAGQASYAPPDPWVGGAMALTSPLYPRGPIDVSERLHVLPVDGSIPFLPDWRWLATPGHSPGHVSLFRDRDRLLIAGDACVTTRQEYLIPVLTQAQHLSGPPRYFTHDWQSAEDSVRRLAELQPSILATGHGTPMRGRALRDELTQLANQFRETEIPEDGRYSADPVIADTTGPQKVPPPKPIPTSAYIVAGAVVLGAAAALYAASRTLDHDSDEDNNGHLFSGDNGQA